MVYFLCFFTLNLHVSVYLKWISYRQQIVGSCFWYNMKISFNCAFGSLTFRVIISVVGLISTIFCYYFLFTPYSSFLFLLTAFSNFCGFSWAFMWFCFLTMSVSKPFLAFSLLSWHSSYTFFFPFLKNLLAVATEFAIYIPN